MDQNAKIFIQEKAFENVFCIMLAIFLSLNVSIVWSLLSYLGWVNLYLFINYATTGSNKWIVSCPTSSHY